MSEPTNQPAPDASSESGRIQETMVAELYDTAIVQERRERSIRFLLNLPPPAPIPADAEARIEQLLARWEEEQKQLQAVLEDQLRQLLGIGPDIPITDDMIPSVEEVREELNKYIPYEESLSDLIIAMREE
jgi:hypothetical protein